MLSCKLVCLAQQRSDESSHSSLRIPAVEMRMQPNFQPELFCMHCSCAHQEPSNKPYLVFGLGRSVGAPG